MQDFFVSMNNYLVRRRRVFFLFFVLMLALAAYYASGVRLEENLNAIIPEDRRISQISKVFSQSEMSDQLVFMLSLQDSTARDPDLLISRAGELVAALEKDSVLVAGIRFRMEDEEMMDIYTFLYDRLPFFLDESDYEKIAARLDAASIDRTIEKDFRSVISPAGMATSRFILKDPLNLTPLALEKLDHFQLDDQFGLYQSCIFTLDRKHLLFFMDPVFSSTNTRENRKLIDHIDQSLAGFEEALSGVQVEYYGGTAVAVANSVRVKKDIYLTLSIALVFFLMIFFLFFRRIRIILLMFLPVLSGAIISVALLTWIYGEVSAIALGVGVIFIGITVDYSLHLFTHLRHGSSIGDSLRHVSRPVIMSAMTTASAFLCLTVVNSEAMKQIGVFAAMAVVISALTVLLVTPLLLRGDRGNWFRASGGAASSWIETMMGYALDRKRVLVLAIVALTVLFAFSSRKLRFNSDIATLNYQTAALDAAEARLQSISSVANSSVYLITQAPSLEEALLKLEDSHDVLDESMEQGLVKEISRVSELLLSRRAQQKKIDAWNRFWDEAGREELAGLIREKGMKYHFREDAFAPFYQSLQKDFTPVSLEEFSIFRELFLDNYIHEEAEGVSLVSILKVEQDRKEALFKLVNRSGEFIIFDNQFFVNQFFDVLREDFGQLVTVSMMVVFLILLLFFGRVEIALATFLPIIISWTWTLGLMGLLRIEINVFNIIISTFIFGLGIDYCIFLMNGVMANYREGKQSLIPYKLSILLSALTTVAAVGVLIFARHPALRSIALVSIFGISTVLLISYTLLPLFFSFLVRSKGRHRLEPMTIFGVISTFLLFLFFLGNALVFTLFLPLIIFAPARKVWKKRMVTRLIYIISKVTVSMGFFIKKQYLGRENLDLGKPSVLIANHQSQLDLILMLQLHPKMIVLVNKWVWNNFFYGFIVRFADFYPIYKGLDYNLDLLKKKVKAGYSILAFPEGRRSVDGKIKRFHQGAFGIADMLELEIQPVLIHGAYEALPRSEHVLKPGQISMRFLPRFKPEAMKHDGMRTYQPQAKKVTTFYREAFRDLHAEVADCRYFRPKLISRFIYKGPVLEWYLRIKLRLEKDYSLFHDLVPLRARITDLGCGYGFLSIMLGMLSNERQITGLDYDEEKIAVAREASWGLDRVSFISGDLRRLDWPDGEVLLLNDVLHYLSSGEQEKVLAACMDRLPEGGMLILRDADASLTKRTRWTRFTEWQSTRVFRFNLTSGKLCYMPASFIEELALEKGLEYERRDLAGHTSNMIHILRKTARP